jgi:hypothetical protein
MSFSRRAGEPLDRYEFERKIYIQQADDGRELGLGADIEGHIPPDRREAQVSGGQEDLWGGRQA